MHTELENHALFKHALYIDGAFCPSYNSQTFDVHNPATNELISQLPSASAEDTKHAIDAAFKAQQKWKNETAATRAALLKNLHALILENIDQLAYILTIEQGKPLVEAKQEIAYGASYIEWFAEEAKRSNGDVIPELLPNTRVMTLKEPVGVVACITPWNFPNAMLARKLAPAIAAGCAVVAKPANETPLSALALATLLEKAGAPKGLFNVVFGNTEEIGAELCRHPWVRKLTFTGSTAVGKLLQAQCAATMKRTSMELGGNAPFIVFEDADINKAVRGAMAAKFRNAGQTCICVNRFLVHQSIYDEFTASLQTAMQGLVLGAGLESTTTIGPLISSKAVKKVKALVQEAVKSGANLSYQAALPDNTPENTQFYPPTLLTNIQAHMRIFKEEIFGPVATLTPFNTEEEAAYLANNTPYGLAAYFYTENNARIWRFSKALENGMVGINETRISNETAPFGGVKESGIGREGSRLGLDEYLNIKYLCMNVE